MPATLFEFIGGRKVREVSLGLEGTAGLNLWYKWKPVAPASTPLWSPWTKQLTLIVSVEQLSGQQVKLWNVHQFIASQ